MELLSPSAQRVQDALRGMGFGYEVIEFAQTTRTAAEAAAAVGCTVGQIAKSLVFKTRHGGRPLLVIASGANRVNEKAMRAIVGEPIEKPDADFVRQQTGFVIGGVPPLGHAAPLTIFIDEDLLQYDIIWAAAGTPNAVFRLAPADLLPMTGGQAIKVT
ncbi:YbaK/EbsC family protein [Candidatus Amarolinea dominans]|uniref:YbaK/EbsC family protein n=1 Tax=Candidatus Amarolinea dominans TaxID=3140696 RepID=UPI001DB1501E|nr:YbaK/EbsC family protein [Anaerolineae bacterium]MBK9093622.1 YbaK/EbsC family protein [Anaerolineae bacterium]